MCAFHVCVCVYASSACQSVTLGTTLRVTVFVECDSTALAADSCPAGKPPIGPVSPLGTKVLNTVVPGTNLDHIKMWARPGVNTRVPGNPQ